MSVKVYRYGLGAPVENEALVRAQLRAAHHYRNALVEVERWRRAEHRRLLGAHPGVGPAEAAVTLAHAVLDEALTAVKRVKGASRSGAVPSELRAALHVARSRKADAVRAFREARAALRGDEALNAERARVDETAAQRRKALRASCGVYWGTYLGIEAADEQSRKQPLYDGAEPLDPRFMPWTGEGRVGVQFQGGLAVDQVVDDTRMRIEDAQPVRVSKLGRVLPQRDPSSKRSALRRYATLALRVGSDDDRGPVWARWPLVLHRPLPEGGVLKWAHVSLRRIGPREEWSLLCTVESEDRRPLPPLEAGAVAVDLGWRQMDDGSVRVAYWLGQDGQEGELRLSPRDLSGLSKADEVRAVRDRAFDAARRELREWLATNPGRPWLRTRCEWIDRWKAPGRLAATVVQWRADGFRFEGDKEIFVKLEAWRKQDKHLWCWETSQRTGALRARKDLYRRFACDLARRYRTLVIEDFDMREVSRRPAADEAAGNAAARSMRQRAAPSEARLALVHAFRDVSKQDPADTTHDCHSCGSREQFDQAAELVHRCGACGTEWDQDRNAAINLMRRASDAGALGEGGVAREPREANDFEAKPAGRWARAKAKKAARIAQQATAREAAPSDAE